MQEPTNKLSIPAAIIITGVIIALGIIIANVKIPAPQAKNSEAQKIEFNFKPITSADHILGNPNAPITILEYSDFECPYCQMFTTTMESLMSEYGGASGTLAWVYREFPLTSIHPQAQPAALAAECISHEISNDAFWKFTKAIFADQSKMNPDYYASLAAQYGANPSTFASCVSAGTYQGVLDDESNEAQAVGAQGTPYSIMVLKTPLDDATADAVRSFVSSNKIYDQTGSPMINVATNKTAISVNGAMPQQIMEALIKIVLKK